MRAYTAVKAGIVYSAAYAAGSTPQRVGPRRKLRSDAGPPGRARNRCGQEQGAPIVGEFGSRRARDWMPFGVADLRARSEAG